MITEVIEKRDNEIIVKFTGVSPLEALALSLLSMGVSKSETSISLSSGVYDSGSVAVGGFVMPAIETMRKQEKK